MGNKILDYTSIGEKKGKFDALANNIKASLTNVKIGLSYLEKGSISENALNDFQGQIKSRISELDEISSKFKNYLSYIIESNKDEDSKQASQVAEEVGLMKQKSNSNENSGSSGHSGGSSAPAQVIQSAPSDYESYKKETSDRFQKIVDEQKKVDETQDKTISTLTTDFNKYKTENDKTIEDQKKSIQDVFERLKGHDSRISSLESKTNSLELSKTNTVEVPSASYTPITPTPTNTEPAPEVKPVEEIKPKEEKIIEEAPIDTKTPMEIDPSKYDQDLSKELGILDPATNNSSLETEPVTDDNTLVKAAAFGALGLGALGLGGGALYYHNKKKDEELNENNNDYLYDDDEF